MGAMQLGSLSIRVEPEIERVGYSVDSDGRKWAEFKATGTVRAWINGVRVPFWLARWAVNRRT